MSKQGFAVHSLITFKNSQGLAARGTLLKLDRSTVVFEVYNPYSIVQLSEVLQELTLLRNDRVIYQGRGVVSALVNTGLMLIASVTLVDPWQDLSGLLESGEGIRQEVERFVADWRTAHSVRSGYQLIVSEIRSFLAGFSRWLEQVDLLTEPQASNLSLSSELYHQLSAPVVDPCNEFFARFEEEAAHIPEDQIMVHKAFAQRDLHPLIMRSPFLHRAYHKPLGYAGDYEMVNMMLRNPCEGPSIYAQIVNSLNLQIGAAAAHRNRIDILQRILRDVAVDAYKENRPANILNIACGPAIEIQRFIRSEPLAGHCHFRLLDFSEETLAYTSERITDAIGDSGNKPEVEFVHESVHNLLKASSARVLPVDPQQNYDLVYCAGLFDYLSDKVCSKLLRLYYSWTKPGGQVIATNVHTNNPSRYWMEHILEWYLIYRNEEQFAKLAPDLGRQQVYADNTGINIFLEIQKP